MPTEIVPNLGPIPEGISPLSLMAQNLQNP